MPSSRLSTLRDSRLYINYYLGGLFGTGLPVHLDIGLSNEGATAGMDGVLRSGESGQGTEAREGA